MVEDARFWVVRPRITLSGISGLGTLLSGNYIGFEAGTSTNRDAQVQRTGGAAGHHRRHGRAGSSCSRPATWGRWASAPRCTSAACRSARSLPTIWPPDGKAVELKVFVNAPYDKYVKPGTRFWNASGIDVSLSANGFDVRTESLVALLAGGVAFDTPTFLPPAEPATANTVFNLSADRAAAMKRPDSISMPFVLYFKEPLRGLSVGAPVTFFGLQVGEVTDVGLRFDPVTLDVSPARGHRLLPRAVCRAPAHGAAAGRRAGRAQRGQDARLAATPDQPARHARTAAQREPAHRPALRGVRLFPRRAEGAGRLETGSAGAAGDRKHAARHREQGHHHPGQARPAAAGCHRRRICAPTSSLSTRP